MQLFNSPAGIADKKCRKQPTAIFTLQHSDHSRDAATCRDPLVP
jgi:hypothetical protein